MIYEIFNTNHRKVEIGPYHQELMIPLKLLLEVDGEVIVSCQPVTGFCHRGIEKTLTKLPWGSTVPIASRLDPGVSIFSELAYCMAVEEISQLEVTQRAQVIRRILCELAKISSHLKGLASIAGSVSAVTVVHYISREREKILDVFEAVTGARFFLNTIGFGGVRHNITEGMVDKVLIVCEEIKLKISEYHQTLSNHVNFQERAINVGVLNNKVCNECGVTGPNLLATNLSADGSDAYDRYWFRINETLESIKTIEQQISHLGTLQKDNMEIKGIESISKGESFITIPAPEGELGCYVASDGGDKPMRVQFKTPSVSSLAAFTKVIEGCWLSDLAIVFTSLNISIAEVDK